MKVFAVEIEKINTEIIPRVELNSEFKKLKDEDIIRIHDLVSNCYKDIMKIYISKPYY